MSYPAERVGSGGALQNGGELRSVDLRPQRAGVFLAGHHPKRALALLAYVAIAQIQEFIGGRHLCTRFLDPSDATT